MLKNRVFNKEVKFISIKDCEVLRNYGTFHNVNKNQVIYYKGHYPYGIFVVVNGEILIETSKRSKAIIKSPVILGYNSFIKNSAYPITSVALTNANVFYISKTRFEEDLLNNEDVINIFS